MQITFSGYEEISANFVQSFGHSWLDITSDRTGEMELTIHQGTLSSDQLRRIASIISEGKANDSHVELQRSRLASLHPDIPF
jgi:hypothetical protein